MKNKKPYHNSFFPLLFSHTTIILGGVSSHRAITHFIFIGSTQPSIKTWQIPLRTLLLLLLPVPRARGGHVVRRYLSAPMRHLINRPAQAPQPPTAKELYVVLAPPKRTWKRPSVGISIPEKQLKCGQRRYINRKNDFPSVRLSSLDH